MTNRIPDSVEFVNLAIQSVLDECNKEVNDDGSGQRNKSSAPSSPLSLLDPTLPFALLCIAFRALTPIYRLKFTMKVALLISALAGANAFAPASQSRAATSLAASAELDNMRGLGPENGYTVVRELRGVCSCHRCLYIILSH